MVIMPTVDELTEPTVMRNMRKLAEGVDKNFTEMQTSVDNAVETANNAMEATEGFDDRITDNATAIQNEVTARQNADEAEADARAKADITGIVTAISSGAINVTLNRELGNLSDSVVGPFIKTATLIPSATDRAFKLQFQYWDDTTYTTNDFVIPEGGGTDVSVSGVTVSEGDNDNEFKVSIQLDDATTIDSNSYPFPESVTNPYPTAIMLSVGGTTPTMLNVDITLSNNQHETGSVDLASLFTDYAKTADVDEQISDIQEQITGLKLSSDNNNMILNGDSVTIVKSVSGTVSDGNLKITVNGVESGDIPLPESGFPIFDFGNTPTSFYSTMAVANNVVSGVRETDINIVDVFGFQYVANTTICGNFPTNLIKNGLVTTIRRTSSQTMTGTWFHPTNDISLSIQETAKECFLENGTYRVILDKLVMSSAVNIRRLQRYAYDYEGEYITFTVNNNIATFNAQTITLKKEHFIQGSGIYIINSVEYGGDRIIKVS